MNITLEITNYINAIAVLPQQSFLTLSSSIERISILSTLAKNPLTLTELSENLGISKSSVYRHLKRLQSCGWITQLKDKSTKKIVYVPTALIYLCYVIDDNKLIIQDDTICVIVPHCRVLLLKFQNKLVKSDKCPYDCDKRNDCLRDLRKLAKKLGIDYPLDDADSIISIYKTVALKELMQQLASPLLTIPVSRARLLYRELLTTI
ncbi:MAG: winged helix-turn-helix transcriptional regulator [Crenarchaeota archaeon]|nr:winged helix-turn-helix transcriptional regulator [Thermoproteota archaeon]